MKDQEDQPTKKYVIAIDVGTSGTKVGLVNQDGKVVAYAGGRYETHFLPNGGAEQVPADWWQVISSGVKQVVKESGVAPDKIAAIGTTSQWGVTVAADEHGEPLMNAISWMDSRGGKYSAKLVKGFPNLQGYAASKLFRWIKIVGIPPSLEGIDDIAHILFIKNEFPDIYRRTYKFLEPMDFINMRLTGKANATQNSNIAIFLIDNRKGGTKDYDSWALKLSGIDRAKLPDLLPVEGIVGNLQSSIASEWGLSPDTVVITSANDNSVAPIGSGAIADYEAVAVLGTSGMLVLHFPNKKTDVLHSLATYPGALSNKYVFFADTGNTGKVVDSFINNLVYGQDAFCDGDMPEDIYAKFNQAVAQVPAGSDGVLFMPWFTGGTLAPTADQFLRGGFINLTTRTTRNHLARAVLEGITYNWCWLKEASEAFTKHKFPYWRLTGGGARSDMWAQIMADVLGIPMHQQENPSNNTLLGVAFLAFNRLGLMSLDDIPKKIRYSHIYEPNSVNREVYDRMYAQFRQCTKQLKPIFHALNKPA
ncbi:MAG: FGGY-family carbohydrate kinase [Anaerolineales bacterium]